MDKVRKERFNSSENDFKFSKPDCKECKNAINFGVDGCNLNLQTDEIKFGLEKCQNVEI